MEEKLVLLFDQAELMFSAWSAYVEAVLGRAQSFSALDISRNTQHYVGCCSRLGLRFLFRYGHGSFGPNCWKIDSIGNVYSVKK
jgi:hypothetical protein